jgi:HTH-type transcriptional regulator/antitoxin HipB
MRRAVFLGLGFVSAQSQAAAGMLLRSPKPKNPRSAWLHYLFKRSSGFCQVCRRGNESLCRLTYNPILCAKAYIDDLSGLAYSRVMNDLARDPRQLGNVIRNARKGKGWSQAELGRKVGLRQSTISMIETGNPATTLETLLGVLAALELEFQIASRSKAKRTESIR